MTFPLWRSCYSAIKCAHLPHVCTSAGRCERLAATWSSLSTRTHSILGWFIFPLLCQAKRTNTVRRLSWQINRAHGNRTLHMRCRDSPQRNARRENERLRGWSANASIQHNYGRRRRHCRRQRAVAAAASAALSHESHSHLWRTRPHHRPMFRCS